VPALANATPYAVLSNFGRSADDGAAPTGLVELDGALWGTTTEGGSALSFGTLFRVTPRGRQTILAFTPDGPRAGFPGPLIVGPDRRLYGTTGGGLFSFDPAARRFSSVAFDGPPAPIGPNGPLASDGHSLLYGIASTASLLTPDCGAVYSYDVRTHLVHTIFSLPWGGGACPLGEFTTSKLTYDRGLLYGSVRSAQSLLQGAVFSIHADGSGFRILHSFTGGYGGSGAGPLVVRGDTIYGISSGSQGRADPPILPAIAPTIYAMRLDGSGLHVLHAFGTGTNWTSPDSLSIDCDGNLFGTTGALDANGAELVFEIARSGTYRVLHTFTGSPDGLFPVSVFASQFKLLFGVTTSGGTGTKCASSQPQEGCGTIFALHL
jgi:uncharacterized repeat protein (TIGR03803 family)